MNEDLNQDQMVVNNVDDTTDQNSPADVTTQDDSTEVQETSDVLEQQNDSDRNWRALREENKNLKRQLDVQSRPNVSTTFEAAKGNQVMAALLSNEDQTSLMLDEFKAQQSVSWLDPESESYNKTFDRAVAGEYYLALNEYANSKLLGQNVPRPSPTAIAKRLKVEWDSQLGTNTKQAREEGAKLAKEAISKKEATVSIETDNAEKKRGISDSEAQKLRHLTRLGGSAGDQALAARLANL